MGGTVAMTRLLLVGAAGSEFALAAAMARDAGAEVAMAGTASEALALLRNEGADLAMIDVSADVGGFIEQLRCERMALPVYACGIEASAALAVAAIRAGARDYLPLPPDRALIAVAIMSVAGNPCVSIGSDPALVQANSLALAMARARMPLTITGEPGCGKELLARCIHAASQRRGRFIVVDCLEIGSEMIDSELFGHDAGAFAGAVAPRSGRIADAVDGTLYLREVGILPIATQERLKHLLRDNLLRSVAGESGEGAPTPLRARIIAGTSLDLDTAVAEGRFLPGLLAALGLVRLAVPPLRRRGSDIAALAQHFADRFARANDLPSRPVSAAALTVLQQHGWPGNVAELEDVIHRSVFLAAGTEIPASAIVLADGSGLARSAAVTGADRVGNLVGLTVEDVERDLILQTLKACRGNRTSASTILGISVRTMRNKLKTFIEAGLVVAPAS
jgi:DNA-binding NtrC family response regulator